jgi:hypothetical protein
VTHALSRRETPTGAERQAQYAAKRDRDSDAHSPESRFAAPAGRREEILYAAVAVIDGSHQMTSRRGRRRIADLGGDA